MELTQIFFLVGSGSVTIPDYEKYPMLGKPITDDPIRSGPIYEASWTHALHCVSLSNQFHGVQQFINSSKSYIITLIHIINWLLMEHSASRAIEMMTMLRIALNTFEIKYCAWQI
jgi:hypothetical protein